MDALIAACRDVAHSASATRFVVVLPYDQAPSAPTRDGAAASLPRNCRVAWAPPLAVLEKRRGTMNRHNFFLLAAFVASSCASARAAENFTLAITNVNVVDVQRGRLLLDRTVLVKGERIVSVRRGRATPDGTRTVDGTGRFLIPGLWDMHRHIEVETDFPMFVALGVTGLREMGSAGDAWQTWRQPLNATSIRPRVRAAGKILDGERTGELADRIKVRNSADAEAAVARLAEQGADFIKVHDLLLPEAYDAIVAAARAHHLPVAGHVPVAVPARYASERGQRSIEHLGNLFGGLLIDSSSREESIRARLRDIPHHPFGSTEFIAARRAEAVNLTTEAFDAGRARTIAAVLARNHTWQTPTIGALRSFSTLPDSSFANDPNFRYLNAADRKAVLRSPGKWWTEHFTADDTASWRRQYEIQRAMVKILYDAGVPLLAGSDNVAPSMLPGFSLHDELALLVDAGLTPAAALRTATLNPALYFNEADRFGTVAEGRVADLVLLDRNPLLDVRNTRTIRAVILNGRLLDRATLDGLLADAARAAAADVAQ